MSKAVRKANFSFIQKYHFRWMLLIALIWTSLDIVYWVRFMRLTPVLYRDDIFVIISPRAIILRLIIVFFMSGFMGYVLLFKLRPVFRNYSLFESLIIKTFILLLASFVMNFLLHITYSFFILNFTFVHGLRQFFFHARPVAWLFRHSIGWVLLFLITQVAIEVNEKYAPGVFWDILIGRYIRPKVQKRIVMFLDLQDSTPIAEKLGSTEYFRFIRDFIYYVSVALLESNGRIYQYVGDEVVVSWMYSRDNVLKCVDSLELASKLLRRRSNYFRVHYGFVPEFKAGIHIGEVTVGEIGIVKKDLAMSGDTMNTAARIRTSCNELNKKIVVSKEFFKDIETVLDTEALGIIDLKGKTDDVELFALKI